MKHYLSGSLLALLFLLTVGCSHREPAVLRQAEALMQPHPDSALALLQTCNRRQLSGRTLARYALLYTMAQNRSLIEVRSDSLLSIAYDYYLRHPSDTLAPRAHLYMGRYYALLDSTKRAEDCLRQCIRLCKTHKDYYTEYLALHSLSRCVWVGDPQQALNYLRRAYKLYGEKCSPRLSNKVYMLDDFATCFNLLEETDSALLYINKALDLAEESKDSMQLSNTYQTYSTIYLYGKTPQKAFPYSQKAWKYAIHKSENMVLNMSNSYIAVDSLEQARNFLSTLIKSKDIGMRYSAFLSLREIAKKQNNIDDLYSYSDSMNNSLNSMYEQAEYDKVEFYKEAEQMEVQQERERSKRAMQRVIFLFSALVSVLLIILLLQRKKNLERTLLYERQKSMSDDLLHKEEIANRDKRMAMLSHFLVEKVNVLQRVEREKIKDRIILSEYDWKEIEFFLNETDNNFAVRIKESFPMLDKEDVCLCMLLRLNIENSTLEKIYLRSKQYVKQKQTILKKKMGLSDIPVSLRRYLQSF